MCIGAKILNKHKQTDLAIYKMVIIHHTQVVFITAIEGEKYVVKINIIYQHINEKNYNHVNRNRENT